METDMDEEGGGPAYDDNIAQAANRLFDANSTTVGHAKGLASHSVVVPIEQRMTTRYMTKYERARLLGTRALQLRYPLLAHD